MAIQNIETEYKPHFSLGALYSGFNAANTQQSNAEEILRSVLANKQKQQEMPYDLMVKQYEGTLADAKKNDPRYIAELIKGYIGQMQSQQAAGSKAMSTVDTGIRASNAENINKASLDELLSAISQSQLQGDGTIGDFSLTAAQEKPSLFGMSPSNPIQGALPDGYGKGSVWPDGLGLSPNPLIPFGAMASEASLRGTMDKEMDGVPQQNNTKQPLFSNMWNAAVNTPEQAQKMQLGEQRGNFTLDNTSIRAEASLAAARDRINAASSKWPSLQQELARQYRILEGTEAGDPELAEMTINRIINDKITTTASMQKPGGLSIQDGQLVQVPPSAEAARQSPALSGTNNPRFQQFGNRRKAIQEEQNKGVVEGKTSSGVKFKITDTGK